MVDRRQAEAASGQRSRPRDALQLETLPGTQPVVVVDLRCKGTDFRMQPPGLIEEETAILWHRRLTGQQVIQGRDLGSRRMETLLRLLELPGVAQENQTLRGGRPREGAEIGRGGGRGK